MEADLSPFVQKVSGEKKWDAAVVMPSGADTGLLLEHLKVLSKQKWKRFDVIVIGESLARAPEGLNAVHYREKVPLGSSGSFAIGQMLAYQLGYEFIINADLDCLPSHDDFMQKLVECAQAEGKAILPLSDEEGKKQVYCINRYGIVPRKAMEAAGFEYACFYKGAEDIDYQLRLESLGLLSVANGIRTAHPYLSMAIFEVASRGPKYLYYSRAAIALLCLSLYRALSAMRFGSAALCALRLLYEYCYHLLFSFPASGVLFGVLSDGFLLNFRKRYEQAQFSIPSRSEGKNHSCVLLEVGNGNGRDAIYFRDWGENIGMPQKILRRASYAANFLRMLFAKGGCFLPSAEFIEKYPTILPCAMFLKPVCYKGREYSWGKHPLSLLLGAALLAAALPLFPLAAAFSLLKIRASGDYPPKAANAGRMLKNFASIVGAGEIYG